MVNILFDSVKEGHKQIQKFMLVQYLLAFFFAFSTLGKAEDKVIISSFEVNNVALGFLAFFAYWACYVVTIQLCRNLNYIMNKLKKKDTEAYEIAVNYPSLANATSFLTIMSLPSLIFSVLLCNVINESMMAKGTVSDYIGEYASFLSFFLCAGIFFIPLLISYRNLHSAENIENTDSKEGEKEDKNA